MQFCSKINTLSYSYRMRVTFSVYAAGCRTRATAGRPLIPWDMHLCRGIRSYIHLGTSTVSNIVFDHLSIIIPFFRVPNIYILYITRGVTLLHRSYAQRY